MHGGLSIHSLSDALVILGAAGLLRGRRATTHWAARDALAHFGATAVDERVVSDGKLMTGAGVSAGLDLALSVVAALRGQTYAQALMLQAEYAPRPPFAGGDAASTDPKITKVLQTMLGPFVKRAKALTVDP